MDYSAARGLLDASWRMPPIGVGSVAYRLMYDWYRRTNGAQDGDAGFGKVLLRPDL